MNTLRRTFLQGSGALSVALVAGWVQPARVLAAEWNKAGFESRGTPETLRAIGAGSMLESNAITIKAPELAESGTSVPIEVSSQIAGTHSIAVMVERNAQPLAAQFNFESGTAAYVSTRLKIGETSNVRVVVKAGDKTYTAVKQVKVTIGGCGGTTVQS
jgi:sulfur-oxidizing protein SoxY